MPETVTCPVCDEEHEPITVLGLRCIPCPRIPVRAEPLIVVAPPLADRSDSHLSI